MAISVRIDRGLQSRSLGGADLIDSGVTVSFRRGILYFFFALYGNERYHGRCRQSVHLIDPDQSGDTVDLLITVGDTGRIRHDDGIFACNGRDDGVLRSRDIIGRLLRGGDHCVTADLKTLRDGIHTVVDGVSLIIRQRKHLVTRSLRWVYRVGK